MDDMGTGDDMMGGTGTGTGMGGTGTGTGDSYMDPSEMDMGTGHVNPPASTHVPIFMGSKILDSGQQAQLASLFGTGKKYKF
jgi:hypothetical protein